MFIGATLGREVDKHDISFLAEVFEVSLPKFNDIYMPLGTLDLGLQCDRKRDILPRKDKSSGRDKEDHLECWRYRFITSPIFGPFNAVSFKQGAKQGMRLNQVPTEQKSRPPLRSFRFPGQHMYYEGFHAYDRRVGQVLYYLCNRMLTSELPSHANCTNEWPRDREHSVVDRGAAERALYNHMKFRYFDVTALNSYTPSILLECLASRRSPALRD